MSLLQFVERWTIPDYPPEPVREVDLHNAEQQLGVRFPTDYRSAVLSVGLPRPTIALMDAIVERDLDVHAVGDFFAPKDVIDNTLAWRQLGLPDRFVAFASDDCGNKFCFAADQLEDQSAADKPIWFFDHDFDTVEEIAPSFAAWIDAFCCIEPLGDAIGNTA